MTTRPASHRYAVIVGMRDNDKAMDPANEYYFYLFPRGNLQACYSKHRTLAAATRSLSLVISATSRNASLRTPTPAYTWLSRLIRTYTTHRSGTYNEHTHGYQPQHFFIIDTYNGYTYSLLDAQNAA